MRLCISILQDHAAELHAVVDSLGGVDAVMADPALQQRAVKAMDVGQRLTLELVCDGCLV